jgi:hypothetical protein
MIAAGANKGVFLAVTVIKKLKTFLPAVPLRGPEAGVFVKVIFLLFLCVPFCTRFNRSKKF